MERKEQKEQEEQEKPKSKITLSSIKDAIRKVLGKESR